ncbi:MAG TPA: ABC transporter permease [Alphaproteobacteria bacterium]|nr:ABC transporter permease [Alphaproteobacteria bacterium]
MKIVRQILRRLMFFSKRRQLEQDLNEEFARHLELKIEDNLAQGLSAEEARRRALLEFGNPVLAQENSREKWGYSMLESLLLDVRYAARQLRKNLGFAIVAVFTLALGIGANSAIFSVVNGVLLRPLPYKDPAKLMYIFNSAPSKGLKNYGASPPDFRAMRERNHTLASLSGYYSGSFNLTGGDQPELVPGNVVSAEYFTTLGVKPALGRTFLPGEEQWGAHHVVVLSEGFWRTHFNSDPDALNKTLTLNGETYTIIGILPASFYIWEPNKQLWVPMAWKPKDNYDSHNNYFLEMVGRLKPGVTREQAYSDLNAIMLAIAEQFPENKGIIADLEPLHETWVGDVRPALMILLGAVGFVLLIACVNLANLMLARCAGRKKEIGIRSALGASRGRLLRQFMTESIVVSLLGGMLGLGLAYFLLSLLPLAQNILPRMQEIRLDPTVLLFTFGVSVLTGVLFGIFPALQSASSKTLGNALKEGGRSSDAGGKNRARTGLVISEVALALVLLIGSGLTIKSFQRLLHVDAGFDPSHVLTFRVNLPDSYDPQPDPFRIGAPPRVAAFYHEFLSRIEQIPGVKYAGATSTLPLQGVNWDKFFVPLDRPLPPSVDAVHNEHYLAVDGHLFSAAGIRLVKGRLLNEHDQEHSPLSVVVNEALARSYWPGQDPIGKNVLLTLPESLVPAGTLPPGIHIPHFTVVGVVSDAHYGGLNQAPKPSVYASVLQNDFSMRPSFAVRVDGDPKALVPAIRNALAQSDKSLPMARISTLEEIMANSVAQPRLEAVLLGLLGGLAMLLAAVGIYGVMSYTVSQRTGEIGIRMALGAERWDVLTMIIGQGLRVTAIGLALGLILALAVTRVLSGVLFGVSPTDPVTFASVALLLAGIAALACYIPAWRATNVDPMVVLRQE